MKELKLLLLNFVPELTSNDIVLDRVTVQFNVHAIAVPQEHSMS